MFNLGDLRGKFIMDRNLGARDETRNVEGKGNLHYQYGRKDPLAGGNVDGSSTTTGYIGRTSTIWELTGVSAEPDGVPIATSVNHPMVKYYRSIQGTNWCSAVNSVSIIWHDMDYDVSSNGKSLFDPSPYGWKVPAHGTWDNFSLDTMTAWNDGEEDDQIGRSYPAEDPIAFYPATGIRTADSASLTFFTTRGYYWYSTPKDELLSNSLVFANSSVTPSNSTAGRASARCIRPVQHPESAFAN